MKKIAWVDTVRVAATLMIISAHYFMCGGFKDVLPYFHFALSYDVAILGVALFLAISGYLIPASLKRAPNLWEFYKRKFVRIVLPFVVCWFVMLAVVIIPALFNDALAERMPLMNFLHGGSFSAMMLGIFPVDLNVTRLLGLEVYWFVGEWFMGTILWLYLLSPLLNYFAARRPFTSLVVSIAISFAVYYLAQEIVRDAWTLFIVQIPEFLFGMILFLHRDKLRKFRPLLILTFGTFLAAYALYFVITFKLEEGMFFMTSSAGFLLLFPVIYLLFALAESLNVLLPKIFARFNSVNDASYVAMIIQHVVIYVFADIVGFENLNELTSFLLLLLIIAIIFKAARLINRLKINP